MGAKVYWDERRSKWFVRVYDGGRQRKQYVGPDREDAEAVAEVINSDLTRIQQEREDGRRRFRLGAPINGEDALRWWFANYRFKRSTRDLNRGRIENHLIPHFGTMDLRRLSALDIRQYADARFATGCSDYTVKGEVSVLRRVLNALVEAGSLERNPVPRIMVAVQESARAHPDPGRPKSLNARTLEEAWALMDYARAWEPHWFPIFFFYFQTGARLGEGLALRWDAVDLFGRDIHIRRAVAAGEEGAPKWNKERHVPISDALHEVLVELARKRQLRELQRSTELVFLGPRKKQILKRNLQRVWERLRAPVHVGHGVRPLSLHSFRHTWVTMMLRDGHDPQWVASAVGDSLAVIYRHYSHVMPDRHRDLQALSRDQACPGESESRSLHVV
jgi:integrase